MTPLLPPPKTMTPQAIYQRERRKCPEYRRQVAEYQKQRRLERRARLLEMLGGKCKDCGATERLEFHHVGDVNFRLSGGALLRKWSVLEDEASKCVILCKFCHLKVHPNLPNPKR